LSFYSFGFEPTWWRLHTKLDIIMFLLSQFRYLSSRTIYSWDHHPPSSQCFGRKWLIIYHYWNLQFLNYVIIIKNKVISPQALVILADLHSPRYAIGFDIYVFISFVVITVRSFPGSVLITGFVTGITRRRPIMEQELLTLPRQLSLPHVIW
jgi:hypothetical protein